MAKVRVIAIVPIRIMPSTKHRLEKILDAETRQAFSKAMLSDVLRAITDAELIHDVYIITSNEELEQELTKQEYKIFKTSTNDLNLELSQAVAQIKEESTQIIIILADLPLLTGQILDDLIQNGQTLGRPVIAHDWKGTGTNILFFTPPNPFHFHFGTNSLESHNQAAQQSGVEPVVYDSMETGLDIDDGEALKQFMVMTRMYPKMQSCTTYKVLNEFIKKRRKEAV